MIEKEIVLPCGCTAVEAGCLEGYVLPDGHDPDCNKDVLREQAQARKEERFQSRVESTKRNNAPLYSKPFGLMR